ncbi:putative Sulfotransferase domain, P-loop containing nucleoside triphosphate hydrolase [Arabidopsis thaliana]|jgi:LPS sulfotransferase NodH|uniref:Sulfotransferase n=5 Tax=Arabidopsis TaxID=3701 RepID=A0A384KQX9_ARATH|nr:P-loop containing nucleoside triphosphate hydrolases superfamily protein [Arabidopsis thaliana]KAG7628021.1 Sulfotransferase domain [Arabidopsis thaliana x Arabidopsis arenosa]KAG7633935.1 Sulfotransferase domain [Arabidopsis suecica]AAS76707.1 At3g50620 [Arabidopsis thaliana]ABI49485.1 At3g50620 [Arabidopsis thaliana]AEE78686.1 P-loop containing nucleoside triphosphate hydrolases superfamily protein [Arabidopsis thaliana]|eukprot:NP_190631.2 P-loop containing nucleoside triphosphate hydrolases superfamily protein [Arabidopsis thaliana]
MAEYICLFGKDSAAIVIKQPKKSPLFLRMIVLVFAMVCGLYICAVCLKQLSNVSFQTSQLVQTSPIDSHSLRFVTRIHYPKPQTFNRAECGHNPVRYFAILSMQRSGSGWFETLLNSHNNVSSNGEIFSVLDRRKNISSIIQTLDRVYNLDWFTSASKNECSAAIGFKWMLNQGLLENHKDIVEYFNRRGVSAIFLFRRNPLRRMVSVLANSYDRYAKLLNGTHKSHVHSPAEADALSRYKPVINSTSLIHDLQETENSAAKALEYFNTTRHIVVFYEDLITNQTTLKQVQEFLNIPVKDLSSRQVKIHRGDLSDHIKNWEDINKTLNGTEYEKFLRADY